MMRFIIALLLLLIPASFTTSAQNTDNKAKAVVIPSEIYFPTIVVQQDCPLKIEKAVIGKMLDGTERMFFQARNTGSKPIVSFQIDMAGSNAGGLTSIFPYKGSPVSVQPGDVAPPGMKEEWVEFVPLTQDLKVKLGLTGKMRVIAFFMVVRVEFQDGTTYDATPLVHSLEEHLKMFEDK